MRIYSSLYEAFRETERDLYEMGTTVHPHTMQDKVVEHDEDYATKEIQAYGFKLAWTVADKQTDERQAIAYIFRNHPDREQVVGHIMAYIEQEMQDRWACVSLNPGNSWKHREHIWKEFLHNGRFHYTYSDRIAPQLAQIIDELTINPDTRQAVVTIHSNIKPEPLIELSYPSQRSCDLDNMGGGGRVPCSLHYQFLRRNNHLGMIYLMRSCDFLTHFPVDVALALRLQSHVANDLCIPTGVFTYFTGSLHAYNKDLKVLGIF